MHTGKYRFNKKEFETTAGGLPRLMVRCLPVSEWMYGLMVPYRTFLI